MFDMRRFVFLLTVFFWQGGFTFYTAVVVPIGTRELDSPVEQGFITREVTNYLNLAGGVCLTFWAIELWCQNHVTTYRRLRWALWGVLAVGLVVLIAMHPVLDSMLIVENHDIVNPPRFRLLHRIYLWISTVQWFAGIALLHRTVAAWFAPPESGRA